MNDVLAKLGPLPSPAGVALEIMQLSARETVSFGELARIAQRDPALAGRLLKAANAPGVFARRPAASVQEALMRLGLPATRRLALAFSLVAEYRDGRCAGFDYPAFWMRSVLRGLAARSLAAQLRAIEPEEGFCCGLLGRIGELALATAQPLRYAQVLAKVKEAGTALVDEERVQLAIDHVELTLLMLEDWGFPGLWRQAVEAFLKDVRTGEPAARALQLGAVLSVADGIALAGLAQGKAKEARTLAAERRGAAAGIEPGPLRALAAGLSAQAAEWAQMFSLEPPAVPLLGEAVAPEGEASAPPAAPLRVLVVDDDPAMLIMLRGILQDAGYAATIAHNGKEALAAAARQAPQMVISDWVMPEMDGLELCRALRSSDFGRSLHFMVVTSYEDHEHIVQALEAGADDYVVKPFMPRVLLARVDAGRRKLVLRG